jgi:antitoxin component YwqK of YwqJK toxin-antitoxin module
MIKTALLVLLNISLAFAVTETRKTYYPDGVIRSAITYKDGKKNGAEHIFYRDGAIIHYSRNYVHGKLHGLQQEYDAHALLLKEESYDHGRLDGRSRYYRNGLLLREIEYRRGMLDGTYREFTKNGVMKVEIIWKSGKVVRGYEYDENGRQKAMPSRKLLSYESRMAGRQPKRE